MPLCEKCQSEVTPKPYEPGCPQCVRALKLDAKCSECIRTGNGVKNFPMFEAAG